MKIVVYMKYKFIQLPNTRSPETYIMADYIIMILIITLFRYVKICWYDDTVFKNHHQISEARKY
jgi:hypothetical protein